MSFVITLQNLIATKSVYQLAKHIAADAELKLWLDDQTNQYNPKNIMESAYIALHGAPPLCACGYKKKFNTFVLGYRQCCVLGNKCAVTNQARQEKQQKTVMEKYGVSSTTLLATVEEKRKKTMLDRYGVEYGAQSVQARQKLSQARANLSADDKAAIKEKTKKTMQARYGVDHHMQLAEKKQQVQHTNLQRYGVKLPLQSAEIRKKQQETIKNQTAEQRTAVKHKQRSTFLEKYGVDAASRISVLPSSLEILQDPARFIAFVTGKTRDQAIDELSISTHTLYLYAKKYQAQQYFSKPLISKFEQEILDFVNSLVAVAVTSDRTILAGQEIDIYIPELKIGIECSGLYWHSEQSAGKDKHYHNNKFQSCLTQGITLITIFEDEWVNKKQQVKNRLANYLTKQLAVYARSCTVQVISVEQANSFVDQQHTQGSCAASINLGLYYKDTLVSVMTFGYPRFSKKYQFELVRFCSEKRVTGAASKLFSYFVKQYNPVSVVSYSDNCWGTGGVYSKLGFTKIGEKVGYWYTDYKKRYNRMQFQKHKIAGLVENADNKTEWDIARELGYDRIWDCGQVTWMYLQDINNLLEVQ